MRVMAIGDIHGCLRALDVLLAAVDLQPDDQLVTLGDYVDRGPDSAGVLERLIGLKQTHQLVALRGNHDQMMVLSKQPFDNDALWLGCGGLATLASYGPNATLEDVPAQHWDFLENGLVDWHEIDTHFFVHASVYADMPLAEQPAYMLLWEKLYEPVARHCSGKIMVCGHTQQRSGEPWNLEHAVCIDTWVYGEGWLTCLDVHSGKVWQANQKGELRQAWLDDFPLQEI